MTHRRSGSAVWEFIKYSDWVPRCLFLAGVGVDPQEAIHFHEDWPNATIVGFEPNPVTFEGLLKNFPGKLIQAALSDKAGKRDLHFRHTWKNGSTLNESNDGKRTQAVMVPVMTLSELWAPPHSLLWLDVEGEELRALQGAGDFLKNVEMINVEMTGKPRGDNWCLPGEVHEFLMRAGFLQTYTHTIRTCRGQFDAIYVRPNIFRHDMCSCLASLPAYESWLRIEASRQL